MERDPRPASFWNPRILQQSMAELTPEFQPGRWPYAPGQGAPATQPLYCQCFTKSSKV